MKRATITLPDDLAAGIDEYLRLKTRHLHSRQSCKPLCESTCGNEDFFDLSGH